jgi:hypothetical protein
MSQLKLRVELDVDEGAEVDMEALETELQELANTLNIKVYATAQWTMIEKEPEE